MTNSMPAAVTAQWIGLFLDCVWVLVGAFAI
jgi:hypothetical protein